MKRTITFQNLEFTSMKYVFALLLFSSFLVPSTLLGQCIPEVTNFPVDITINNNNDECTATVTWGEPSYALECEDFDESFDATDPTIWSLNDNGENGSVNTASAPAMVSITGSTSGTAGTDTDTDFCITIPFTGTMSFDWTATANAGGAQLINDEPAYTIDGTETILNVMAVPAGAPVGTGVSTESGVVEDLAVTAGQVFCFRVKSNNQGATTTLDLSGFSFEITQIEQTDGVAIDSEQPPGIYPIEYSVPSCDGTLTTCDFNVRVVDNQSPVIDCPSDSIIQLTIEQCDTLVTYDVPEFTDNCPDAVITQIEGLPSGSLFPIGENVISFEARDTTGNADTCTFSIIVVEYEPNGLLCNGVVNFSIDETLCSGELLPSMLIDVSTVGCADSCTITYKGEDGIKRPAIFSTDDIGNSYEYEICCGGICCWGIVNVEYKFDPEILCVENDTLSCTQAFDESTIRPDISISCAPATLLLIDEEIEILNCDTFFTAKMVREYTAVDIYGNTSDTCIQTIFLERTNLDSISPVQPFALFNSNPLSCSSGFATTSQGYPFPALSVTGAPRLRVEGGGFVDLFPFESSIICNGFAEFEDKIMPNSTSCVTKILRTFTIGEWWCGGTNEREFKQFIEVVDFEGPEITCPVNMTVSTSSFECSASVTVPLPGAMDKCNDDLTYNLGTPVGDFENYNGESFDLGVGVHTLQYAVYDACEQGSFCTFTVTVVDNADPIAICDQFTEVSLSLETTTFVPAEAIDDGSFDECGPVTLSVARMDDPGFEDFTGFGPMVDISCADAGQTVMVGLLVTDAGGNTNMCMVSVNVKDKVEAQMVCPADTTVECNFAFDPDNLGAFFGEVQIFDNCPAANTVDQTIVGSLNTCGSGVLTRQITLFNAQGVPTDFCEQRITFVSGTPLQFSDITPPNSPVEVTGCGIGALAAANVQMPIIPDGVCQQVAIAIHNDTFPFTEEGSCLKIIRTYKVIDWCIPSGPGSVTNPFEFEQIIKVSNTDKPTFSNVFMDSTYCSFAGDCGGIEVNGLTAMSSDLCTADNELLRKYETRNAAGLLVKFGIGNDASGFYELGDYTVTFTAEDKCGNQEIASSTFSVISCKQPVPYCLDGISTSLTLMDPDGDGEFDPMVMLSTDFFDAGSYHPCSLDVTLSFSSNVNDTLLVFDCDDLGAQEVELWVTDSNGNSDFCIASLDVQDTEGLCSQAIDCLVHDFTGWTIATCNADPSEGSGPVGVIYDTRSTGTATPGEDWSPSITSIYPSNWTVDQIGQVFGITTDGDANVYLASSDVYDKQFDVDPFGPATIFKASPSTGFVATVLATLPNTGGALNGIGNIVYDNETNILYASNLEDGKIYSVSASGAILNIYDPWSADNGVPGIAPSTEQVWGLGINEENGNKKLYFPRVGGGERAMYSITLGSDGSFPANGSEVVEFNNIIGNGLRITDVDFSQDGQQMIFAERGTAFITGAHNAKVLRYDLTGSGWAQSVKYFVGGLVTDEFPTIQVDQGENSGGGVSFGPTDVNTDVVGEDEIVWTSMNYFENDMNQLLYGLQGMAVNGNTANNFETDIVIDFDGIYATDNFEQKGEMGDVEIFGCSSEAFGNKVDIQGRIYTAEHAELNDVMVELVSSETAEDMTDENGEYGFMDMPQGGSYIISPNKDDDVLNGVTTLDLVMIQRHILGIADLNDVYKYLAADINHDDKITASDLLTLRKTILGINNKFINNTSWRFIDEQHVFEDETDPWSTPFAESYDIESLTEDMWVDFVAVKVGDINGNVDVNVQSGIISETRSSQSLIMSLPNTQVEADKVYEIDVLTSDAIDLRGLQVALSLNDLELIEVKRGAMNIKSNDFVVVNGNELKMSYANAIGDYTQADDVLYTLVVRAKIDGQFSEMVSINDKAIDAEAYMGTDLNVGSIEIEWRDDEVVAPVELLVAHSASPNPWRSQSEINFEIPRAGVVSVVVRDVTGRVLYTKSSDFSVGKQSFTLTNEDVSVAGILLYELKFGEQIVRKKMIRMK